MLFPLLWWNRMFQAGLGLRQASDLVPIPSCRPCHPRDLQVCQAWAEFPLDEISRSS